MTPTNTDAERDLMQEAWDAFASKIVFVGRDSRLDARTGFENGWLSCAALSRSPIAAPDGEQDGHVSVSLGEPMSPVEMVRTSIHPVQPLVFDEHGVLRFKENKIVSRLLEIGRQHGCGLNEQASMEFSNEDRQQLAQLIGYSLDGYGDLRSYVDDAAWERADAMRPTEENLRADAVESPSAMDKFNVVKLSEKYDATAPSGYADVGEVVRKLTIISNQLSKEPKLFAASVIDEAIAALQSSRATDSAAGRDVQCVIHEVERATVKFPTWPTDPLHAVAVLGEEFGELTKAALQLIYEPHKSSLDDVRTEAIQTAAMALRFVMSLDRYEYKCGEQHSQSEGKS